MIFLLLVSVSSESVPLQVGRIIGKGGTNVREMQRITGAVIKLPEQVCHCRKQEIYHSYSFMIYFQGTSTGDETSVHIVGSFYSIQVGNYSYNV